MMVNYRIYIFLAALGAGIIAYSFQPLSFLVVRDKTTGEEIFTQRISPGEKFKLTYIHSVEKIMVTGIFTVDEDNRIILLETYFPSPGNYCSSAIQRKYRGCAYRDRQNYEDPDNQLASL